MPSKTPRFASVPPAAGDVETECPPRQDDEVVGASTGRAWVLAGVAAGLAAAAYANGLYGPFVYDDFREVLHNPSIGRLGDLPTILRHSPTRPLTNLSYAVDFRIGGLHPFTYHLTNLLLHVANVGLLFGIVRHLVGDARRVAGGHAVAADMAAFIAASLFAVHPMLTEAVTYISSRSEVLFSTFALASIWSLLVAIRGGGARFWIVGSVAFLLGVGAKETAVMVPAVVLAFDLIVARRTGSGWRTRAMWFYLPVGVLAALIGLARTWLYLTAELPSGGDFSWQRILLELHVLGRYTSMVFLPMSQSVVPSVAQLSSVLEWRVLMAVAVVGALTAAGVVTRHREPLIAFGVAWFGLFLVPSAVLYLIAEGAAPMAEHRAYLSSGGLFLAIGATASRVLFAGDCHRSRRARAVAGVCGVAVVAVLMTLTIARNRLWSDPILLWEDAVRKAPRVWIAHMELGHARGRLDNHAAAVTAYRRAVRLVPDEVLGYLSLADSLRELGRHGDAREVLQRIIARRPGETRAMMALAEVEAAMNNPGEALRLCRQVLALAPGHEAASACLARYERDRTRPGS